MSFFKDLKESEKIKLLKKDPDYGEVICRCETVTLGEIKKAIDAPIGARSIDGIKRRTNAGMGRCQGGFCSPKVFSILKKKLNPYRCHICMSSLRNTKRQNKINGGKKKSARHCSIILLISFIPSVVCGN